MEDADADEISDEDANALNTAKGCGSRSSRRMNSFYEIRLDEFRRKLPIYASRW